jgi:hypothetical protein
VLRKACLADDDPTAKAMTVGELNGLLDSLAADADRKAQVRARLPRDIGPL